VLSDPGEQPLQDRFERDAIEYDRLGSFNVSVKVNGNFIAVWSPGQASNVVAALLNFQFYGATDYVTDGGTSPIISRIAGVLSQVSSFAAANQPSNITAIINTLDGQLNKLNTKASFAPAERDRWRLAGGELSSALWREWTTRWSSTTMRRATLTTSIISRRRSSRRSRCARVDPRSR